MKFRTTLYLFGHEYRATIEAASQSEAERLIHESLNRQARIKAEPMPDEPDNTLEQLKKMFNIK